MKLRHYSLATLLGRVVLKAKRQIHRYLPKGPLPKMGLRCGLVGCGHFVNHAYVPAFNNSRLPIFLSGITSRRQKSALHVASQLRYKTRIFDSYEALLESGIEAILITVPNYLHEEYITKAMAKNIHIFCEKPLVNTLQEATKIQERTKDFKKVMMVGFNERYFDRMKVLKSMIDEECLTGITIIHAFHNQNIANYLNRSDWLSDKTKSGGGVLHNAGIHLLNILIYFLGDVDRVEAKLENRKIPESFGEDSAFVTLISKTGVVGTLSASYIDGVKSSYEHLIIKCKEGIINSDFLKSDIRNISTSGTASLGIPCRSELMSDSVFNELSHFSHCVTQEKKPMTDLKDTIKTLTVLEAAVLASQEKRIVPIEEIRRKYYAS